MDAMGTLDPHEQGEEPTPLPEGEALEWKEREAARAQEAHGTCVGPTRPRVPEKYAGAHSNEATSDAARRDWQVLGTTAPPLLAVRRGCAAGCRVVVFGATRDHASPALKPNPRQVTPEAILEAGGIDDLELLL